MSDVVTEALNPYSSIKSWEVWNFMSIAHGKCEFDERNIVNLKGYNDSGKSAMLNALKVLLFNSNPTKQVGFIQDDKEYFRILVTFDDDIQIMRDKYVNGQSLYEMYKDGKCIYTTKSGNALTKVSEVPQPIADYLGLIMYDGVCLNARACFEKQIGVQTTGSENYKMFNTVLKSEEIATAGSLLNNDKNKLVSDINATDIDLQAQKGLLGTNGKLTSDMIDYLKEHDSALDRADNQLNSINSIKSLISTISTIPIIPEVDTVDLDELSILANIESISASLSEIITTPEVPYLDDGILTAITNINNIHSTLKDTLIAPEVEEINNEQLEMLNTIWGIVNNISECSEIIDSATKNIDLISEELTKLQQELINHGVKMVKCPGCGQIFNPDDEHVH